MKQYVTFSKEEFNNNIESIRSSMYYLDSDIRVLEEYGEGKRIAHGADAEYWKKNSYALAIGMRKNFERIRERMEAFDSGFNFDFEKSRKMFEESTRKVLTEKDNEKI